MERRRWLQLGAVSAALAAGTAVWGWRQWPAAREEGRFLVEAAALWRAVARAVLEGLLPEDPPLAAAAVQHWLTRLEATVAALPAPTQAELDLLTGALCQPLARAALTGSTAAWPAATTQELQGLLQQLRTSTLVERQQVYHALRDLTTAAYLADATTWPVLGYPGPALRFQAA